MCTVLNKGGSYLIWKTTNKYLNFNQLARIVERNKDDSLLSHAFIWIASVSKWKTREKALTTVKVLHHKSIKVLWSSKSPNQPT